MATYLNVLSLGHECHLASSCHIYPPIEIGLMTFLVLAALRSQARVSLILRAMERHRDL